MLQRFLDGYFLGPDARAIRDLRGWLVDRGYTDRKLPREAGVSHNEEFTGEVLAILLWLDRGTDWYVEVKPLGGAVGWRPLDEWARCIGVSIEDVAALESQILALREHLDDFEAMCGADRLEDTLGCLTRGNRGAPAS